MGWSWEEVHSLADASHVVGVEDIGAGEEGFVALGVRVALDNTWERFALASADGREWAEAPQPFGVEDQHYRPQPVIAPSGPDWIAATAQRDDTVQIWFSANGLDWTPAAVIRGVKTTQAWAPVLVGADRHSSSHRPVYFPHPSAHPASGAPAMDANGLLDLGDDAVVGGAAVGRLALELAGASFHSGSESRRPSGSARRPVKLLIEPGSPARSASSSVYPDCSRHRQPSPVGARHLVLPWI